MDTMRIAICDDDPAQAAALERMVGRCFSGPDAPGACAVTVFTDPSALLFALEDRATFDLYLLDVLMPRLDCIQLGRKIR